jgi:putative endonuclease
MSSHRGVAPPIRAGRVRVHGREGIRMDPVVYLLRCRDGSLYCGWTLRLEDRLEAHRTGRGSKYVASRLPAEVAAVFPMRDRTAAMREEARIKRLTRAEKEALVTSARGAART